MVTPIDHDEFTASMEALGPFEPRPKLAVAVSGGGDSMALAILADQWARDRGGAVTALIVDHALRPGSADEAAMAGRWLKARRIARQVLVWSGPKPGTGRQEAAREARYALLTDWCRSKGVLHLLLAHHLEDQAETLLLRLGRGSGADGLAAMAALAESAALRFCRPLLGTAPARLRAFLEAEGQPWIEDPSNRDPVFARARLRADSPILSRHGLGPGRLAGTAAKLGRVRQALECDTARLLASAAAFYPAGYCRVDEARLMAAPAEIALRALARILTTVGGAQYHPRLVRLQRLYQALAEGRLKAPRTLGGCHIAPRRDGLVIAREPAAAAERIAVRPGTTVLWDARFQVEFAIFRENRRNPLILAQLGAEGWAKALQTAPEMRNTGIPGPARPALPALWDRTGLVAAPHIGYGTSSRGPSAIAIKRLSFRPRNPLAGAVFSVS